MFLIILIAGIKHVEMTQTYLQWPSDFLPWSLGGGVGSLGWVLWRGGGGWALLFLALSLLPLLLFI